MTAASDGSDRRSGGSAWRHADERGGSEWRVEIALNDEQVAAVEGWRAANRIDDRTEAVKELVRIGLLSEIAKVYRLVAGARETDDDLDRRGTLEPGGKNGH